MIKLDNITKKFHQTIIFENINHEFQYGMNRIEGDNGSGKTTLMNIIGRQDINHSGRIHMKPPYLNSSYLPDVLHTFASIRVNIFIKSILKELKVNLEEQALFLSHTINIEPFIDLKLNQLSVGQKKKVILFLTLIKSKDIWICDEPFSGLDHESTIRLNIFFNKNSQNRVIIMTTHRNDCLFDFKTTLQLSKR